MKHLIFDTETTSLVGNTLQAEKYQPRVVEFYGALFDDSGSIIDGKELDFMCNPGVPIPEESAKITGIRDKDVAGLPGFEARAEEVLEMIREADVVVAHNLSFDMFVIDCEAARIGREAEWPSERICTVEETEHLKGHRLNLSALHEQLFREPFSGAHRARVDVEALARCYFELIRQEEI